MGIESGKIPNSALKAASEVSWGNVEVCIRAKSHIRPALIFASISMKRLGVLLTPLDGTLVYRKITPPPPHPVCWSGGELREGSRPFEVAGFSKSSGCDIIIGIMAGILRLRKISCLL